MTANYKVIIEFNELEGHKGRRVFKYKKESTANMVAQNYKQRQDVKEVKIIKL